jgi:O-antigen/teichoic acid export membrane protein
MNKKEKLVLLKNAAVNVARGSAAAVVAIVLPPFLVRLMTPDAYGTWSLVLQISAYVAYLDFGIQTAIGRFVAHANEKGDAQRRDQILSTSMAVLSIAGALAVAGSIGVAIMFPYIFRQIPSTLLGQARIALVIVASSLAIGLPASTFNGIFIGLQKNEVPASIIAGSRLISAVGLIYVVRHGGGLLPMGVMTAAVNIASYLVQYLMYRRVARGTKVSRKLISRVAARELFDYCFSLTIWSFATLLITGLDLTLVGFFDFRSLGYYSVAATLITFILGLQNAIFATMIPAAAVLDARGDTSELGSILIQTTRYGMFLLLASGVPLLVATRSILSMWVGADYAEHAGVILRVLVIANVIRLSAIPYAMLLIGTGQQRLVTVSPMVEALSNLLISLIAGAALGAIGVALGTLVGAVVGIFFNFIYNMPRSVRIAANRLSYLKDGYLRPLICVSPFLLVAVLRELLPGLTAATTIQSMLLATVLTLVGTWKFGFSLSERTRVLSWVNPSGRAETY